jgi:hypothetical protein
MVVANGLEASNDPGLVSSPVFLSRDFALSASTVGVTLILFCFSLCFSI